MLLVFVFLFKQTWAQTPPPYVPNIIPPSPNASALMKFTDVPVSPYTGTADVSVPIYTIQAKGISIPISLNYHTGGIRLGEEAGWVGLGWALDAGGMISRTVRDKDDFNSGYFSSSIPLVAGDLVNPQPDPCGTYTPLSYNQYTRAFYGDYNVSFTSGVVDFTQAFYSTSAPEDLEPDSYSYNFLGRSGKFIITKDRKVVLQKQENIKIQLLNTLYQDNYTFLVTDEAGTKYYFNDTEISSPLSGLSRALSSWHLTKIITQQNDVVTFSYVSDGTYTYVGHDKTQTLRTFCSNQGWYYGDNGGLSYSNVVLQNIEFTDGRVSFAFDGNREDLQGGRKLNAVKVYSKSSGGVKQVKESDLYYSYFFPGQPDGTKYDMERLRLDSVKEVSPTMSAKPYKFSYNNYSGNVTFDFVSKHAFSIDHWGYFNAAPNTVLIPSMTTTYGGSFGTGNYYYSFAGANREADSAAMQTFSLQQVTYPTGGKTVFNYSPNYYDYTRSVTGPTDFPQAALVQKDTIIQISTYGQKNGVINFRDISTVIPAGFSGTNATINIAFVANSSSGWPSSIRNTFGKLYFSFNGNITDISTSTLSCPSGSQACSLSIPLAIAHNDSTTYTWTAYVDPSVSGSFSLIHVDVSFMALQRVVNSHEAVSNNSLAIRAGGLRINSVTDYSDAATVAKKRIWNYNYGSAGQYSYGKLMAFPSYLRLEPALRPAPDQTQTCWSFTALSGSNTSLTSTIGGNIVGYSQVEEMTVDPATNANIGKTVYNFANSPDSTVSYNGFRLPGIANMGNSLNGSLLSKRIYRNTGGTYFKVKEEYNYYHTANRIVYFVPKYQNGNLPGQTIGGSCGPPSNKSVPNLVFAYFYPAIKSERVLQDSTREIVYDQIDTLKYLTNSSKSYYDNPVHYQLTRSVSTDSKGNRHVSKITYPQDYISGTNTGNAVLDTLIAKNMVATSIEKRDSLYYLGSSTGYVTGASVSRYRQLSSGTVVADKMYKADLPKPVTGFTPMSVSGGTITQDTRYRLLINFDAYDARNNIAQYTVTGQEPVSVLWDYRGMQPIAQVKNADTTSIADTSFEAEGKGRWTITSALRDSLTATISGIKSYNLGNGTISKSGLTAGNTYIVSYWTKSVTPLSITGTITGYPVNGLYTKGWFYHEHRVTGVTSVTLTGTGNIDELRLYPANAQLQSYTYTPLVGVSGAADARSGLSFYEYDSLQRLLNIRDQDGKILKTYDYNYRP
jgi:hypothetical protein